MFKDYYFILEIPCDASPQEIKRSFRTQARKWHPDRNPEVDTTFRMRDINEAYFILSNPDAKALYDEEWRQATGLGRDFEGVYKDEQSDTPSDKKFSSHTGQDGGSNGSNKFKYQFRDPTLKQWIKEAQKKSIEVTRELSQETSFMLLEGLKGALNYAWFTIKLYALLALIGAILLSFSNPL